MLIESVKLCSTALVCSTHSAVLFFKPSSNVFLFSVVAHTFEKQMEECVKGEKKSKNGTLEYPIRGPQGIKGPHVKISQN